MFTIGEFSRLACISARMLRHYDQLVHLMEQELFYKEDLTMNDYHVITMIMKAQNVLTVQGCIEVNETSFHQLAVELRKKMKEQNLTQIGPFQISYLDEEFNSKNANVEMQMEVNGSGDGVKTIPERLCVTVVHIGSLKKINKAYEAIMTWLSLHEEYQISGHGIERLLKDENTAKSEEEQETAVMFPIEKRK